MGIANYLTIFRIFISPIFLLLYLEYARLGISPIVVPYLLLSLLAISEFSDALDGYLARKYQQVTDLGKILDPMADSIYRISVFLTFTLEPIKVPLILIFIFIYRDSVISTLRTLCALNGFTLAARLSGKIKAIIQGIVAGLILILMSLESLALISLKTLQQTSSWLVGLAALYTLFSGIEYMIANRRHISQALTLPKAIP